MVRIKARFTAGGLRPCRLRIDATLLQLMVEGAEGLHGLDLGGKLVRQRIACFRAQEEHALACGRRRQDIRIEGVEQGLYGFAHRGSFLI